MAIRHRSHIMGDICCSIPSTYVQILHVINPPFAISDNFWRSTLGHLHGLRYIKLSNSNMPDLSLLTLYADRPVEALHHMLIPGLEELELYCITFSPEDNWSDEIISDEQSLLDVLSTCKMLHLIMAECDVRVVKEDEEEDRSVMLGPGKRLAYPLRSRV